MTKYDLPGQQVIQEKNKKTTNKQRRKTSRIQIKLFKYISIYVIITSIK